jgi:hypothetical protein
VTNSPAPSDSGPLSFAITWDYRCPFARNAHEHVIAALEDGAPFEVTFVPFSLHQMHREEGDPSVFDNPERSQDLLATMVGIVVRDRYPDKWLPVHRALFALRHDEGLDLRDEEALRATLTAHGVDADAVFTEIADGWPLDTFRKEHDAAESAHSVWGVPTFIQGEQAVFVRVMTRPEGDGATARTTIERIMELVSGFVELNEFKHTSIPR